MLGENSEYRFEWRSSRSLQGNRKAGAVSDVGERSGKNWCKFRLAGGEKKVRRPKEFGLAGAEEGSEKTTQNRRKSLKKEHSRSKSRKKWEIAEAKSTRPVF